MVFQAAYGMQSQPQQQFAAAQPMAVPQQTAQPQVVAQPAATGAPAINPQTGQPDYSAQWAEYYRNMGMHEQAAKIEAQMRGGGGGAPAGGAPQQFAQQQFQTQAF